MKSRSTPVRLLPALMLAGLLAACGRPEPEVPVAPQQPVDPAVVAAEKRADELRADASRALGDARENATGLANRAGEAISDATITATVNAALAADAKLSAMKINVDTEQGVVTLRGPAPDEAARSRATELAANAKGVVRVENELTVPKS